MDAIFNEIELSNTIFKIVIAVGAIALAFVLGILGANFAKRQMGEEAWRQYYKSNFPFIAGLPMATVAAFGLVVYFDVATSGPLKVSFLGFQFKGPAVPSIMWMVLFLSFVLAIKLLSKNK